MPDKSVKNDRKIVMPQVIMAARDAASPYKM